MKAGDPVIAFDGSEQMRELENMQNEADAAQKKLDKKRDDAALARRDDELKIAEAEATLRKASLKTSTPERSRRVDRAKEVVLDEQSAKLALDCGEAARGGGEALRRRGDPAADREGDVREAPRRGAPAATSRRCR